MCIRHKEILPADTEQYDYNIFHLFSRILDVQEPKNFSEKKEECFVLDYYDEYFQNNALSFSNIKEVYTACDLNNLFPVYCVLNKKAVSYIEMYEGQFSDVERYYACTEIFGYPCWWEQLQRKYSSLSGDSGNWRGRKIYMFLPAQWPVYWH